LRRHETGAWMRAILYSTSRCRCCRSRRSTGEAESHRYPRLFKARSPSFPVRLVNPASNRNLVAYLRESTAELVDCPARLHHEHNSRTPAQASCGGKIQRCRIRSRPLRRPDATLPAASAGNSRTTSPGMRKAPAGIVQPGGPREQRTTPITTTSMSHLIHSQVVR
jgi:hypothetical protein